MARETEGHRPENDPLNQSYRISGRNHGIFWASFNFECCDICPTLASKLLFMGVEKSFDCAIGG
jgi:hypothetical protein